MTNPLSTFTLAGGNSNAKLTVIGGAGADTITGGSGIDTITGGQGADNITTGADADLVIFAAGDSNPVYTGANNNATGQDTIADNGTAASASVLRFDVVSTDTAWDITTHVLVGTAGGTANVIASATQGNTDGFAATTVLVQAGAHAAAGAANSDAQDYAVIMNTALTAAQAQAITAVNLTGTAAVDTLVTGANADIINGGAGNDSITPGGGADTVDVSSGDDTVVVADNSGVAPSATSTTAGAAIAAGDTLTFANGVDIVNGFEAGTGGDVLNLSYAGAPITAVAATENALTADKTYFLSGNYVASTGVFTVTADGAGTSTLLIDTESDGDIGTNDSMILLVGVDSDDLVAANII